MTYDIAAVESVWLRPLKKLPYCPISALYLQKQQEDRFREEFRMTDLELAYEAENEISFELSHLRWHIPKSKVFMENLKNES